MIIIAKKKKRRKKRKTGKRKHQILAINHDSKRIGKRTYYSNIAYKSKSKAKKEAKKVRSKGNRFATVKPYSSKTMKGKKSNWNAVYTSRK